MRHWTIGMLITLDDARREGTQAGQVIHRVSEIEILGHEDIADHGTGDHCEILVEDVQVEYGTIFLLTSRKEQIWVIVVFSIMGRITRAESNRWNGLWYG